MSNRLYNGSIVTIQINILIQMDKSGVIPNRSNTYLFAYMAEKPVQENTINITTTCQLLSICQRFFSFSNNFEGGKFKSLKIRFY